MAKKDVLGVLFGVVTLLASFSFWVFWKDHLSFSPNLLSYLPGILGAIFFLASLNLFSLISNRKLFLVFSVFISSNPIFLGGGLTLFNYLSGGILLAGLAYSSTALSKSAGIYKKIAIRNLLQTRNSFYFLVLSLTMLATGNFVQNSGGFRLTIPEEIIPFVTKFSSSLLKEAVNDGSTDTLASAEQAFEKEVPRLRRKLNQTGLIDEDLVRQQLEIAKKSYLSQIKDNLVPPVLNEEVLQEQVRSAKGLVENELNKFIADYIVYVPYLAAVSFFLSIIFFGPLVVGFSDLLFLLIFKILLLLKVFSIRTRTEEVEYLEI